MVWRREEPTSPACGAASHALASKRELETEASDPVDSLTPHRSMTSPPLGPATALPLAPLLLSGEVARGFRVPCPLPSLLCLPRLDTLEAVDRAKRRLIGDAQLRGSDADNLEGDKGKNL